MYRFLLAILIVCLLAMPAARATADDVEYEIDDVDDVEVYGYPRVYGDFAVYEPREYEPPFAIGLYGFFGGPGYGYGYGYRYYRPYGYGYRPFGYGYRRIGYGYAGFPYVGNRYLGAPYFGRAYYGYRRYPYLGSAPIGRPFFGYPGDPFAGLRSYGDDHYDSDPQHDVQEPTDGRRREIPEANPDRPPPPPLPSEDGISQPETSENSDAAPPLPPAGNQNRPSLPPLPGR